MRFATLLVATLGFASLSTSVVAASSAPEILLTESNRVPACASPERLTAFLKSRNPKLDPRFAAIAEDYKRHGEALGIRWDYAFFQMIIETNALSYKTGRGRFGNVKPNQNNFAGIGAAGRGVAGETFPDISTGVLGHLGHIRLYAGAPLDKPAAKRTELVTSIILPWAKGIGRPVTYADLASRWATNKKYMDGIEAVATAFRDAHCTDVVPEETVKPTTEVTASLAAPATAAAHQSDASGAQSEKDFAGGAMGLGVSAATTTAPAIEGAGAKTEILALSTVPVAPKAPRSCQVFTASYGGEKTMIIEAVEGGAIHYTTLSVHDDKAEAQAKAYIDVYAKGGKTIATFPTQTAALEKAFELCPEN